jgi:hypothetical protein
MTTGWGAALLIFVLAVGTGTASAAPNVADIQLVATHQLNEDEIFRLRAVMQDAKSQRRPSPVTSIVSGSIDEAAAHFDAQPGMHAILVAHDFSARDFTIAVLSLSRTVMMAHSGGSGPNVDLYRTHRDDVDSALNLTASGPDFRPAKPDEQR